MFNFIVLGMHRSGYGMCELILGSEVSRFRLAEIEASSKGKGVLKYLVRLGKRVEPSTLEDALLERAAPNVIGARIH